MSGNYQAQTRVNAAELNRMNATTISHRPSRVRLAVETANEERFVASHALAALR